MLSAVAAERERLDLAAELWRVVKTLLQAAVGGDVQAAKLVLDRLTDPDPVEVSVNSGLSEVERAQRVEQLLRIASERRKARDDGEAR